VRTTVAGGLPSSQTSAASGSLVSGVADVAFAGGRLYALEAGVGCSHGLLGTDNSILRVNPDGTTPQVADLSRFQKSHPVAHPNPGDFEPDGTWYSMVAVHGDLYAVEPNHGEIDRIDPSTGAVGRLTDISASQGHIVPTALAYKGNFFFGNLGTFPVTPGSESLFKVTPSGQITTRATGPPPGSARSFGSPSPAEPRARCHSQDQGNRLAQQKPCGLGFPARTAVCQQGWEGSLRLFMARSGSRGADGSQ
jgi:hypothetical protein